MSYFISGVMISFVSTIGSLMGKYLFHIEPFLGAIFSMVFFISTMKLGEIITDIKDHTKGFDYIYGD